MLLAGIIFPTLDNTFQPSQSMLLLGIVSMLSGVLIWFVLRRDLQIKVNG
jgi:hypothetical protein